jgi:hypothetical protein
MQVSLIGLPFVALTYHFRSDYTFDDYDNAVQPITITVRSPLTL